MKWISEKRLFQLHGWLGLNFGLLLFLICFAGTCAVFSHDIDWLIEPALRVEPPAGAERRPPAWDELYRSVAEAHPHASISYLAAPPDEHTAARAMIYYNARDLRWVFIDPYTYEVRGQSTMLNVASFFRIFHKQFYILSSDYWPHGRVFVCVFSFVLLFSAATGLLFYKKWWRSLWRLRFTHGRRVFWSDLHRMAGMWSLLFAVMFSVTGLWYLAAQIMEHMDVTYQPAWADVSKQSF
ncbi:MAG TPA: PepSY-associated TM helix domain-containing protein [Phycisphaeraceae bacterium]